MPRDDRIRAHQNAPVDATVRRALRYAEGRPRRPHAMPS